MSRNLRHIVFFFAVLLVQAVLPAVASPDIGENVIVIDENYYDFRTDVSAFLYLYDDKNAEETFRSIQQRKSEGAFFPAQSGRLNLGFQSNPIWAYFSVRNDRPEDAGMVLTIDDPGMDRISSFWVGSSGTLTRIDIEEGERNNQFRMAFRKPVLPIDVPANSKMDVYLRVDAPADAVLLKFTLSHPVRFTGYELAIASLSGVLFGAIIFFTVFFVRLAIRTKEMLEFWFAANLLSLLAYFAVRNGFFQYVVPNAGPDLYNLVRYLSFGLCYFSYIRIFRDFLNVRFSSRKINQALRAFQWIVPVYAPTAMLLHPWLLHPLMAVVALTPLLAIYSGSVVWVRSPRSNRVFIVGWLASCLGFTLDSLVTLGTVRWSIWAFGLLPISVIVPLFFYPDAIIAKFHSYKNQSIIDGLTNTYNRRYFDNRIRSEWNLCKRTNNPLSLILVDIDRFKAYNDLYGHLAGDDCLRKISQIFKDSVRRSSDNVFRYGGEEFAVLLSGTAEEGAMKIARDIQKRLAIDNLERHDEYGPRVTVSIGVGTVDPRQTNESDMLNEADKALYMAKNNGRNSICAFSSRSCEDSIVTDLEGNFDEEIDA